jgi:hypothetical protein
MNSKVPFCPIAAFERCRSTFTVTLYFGVDSLTSATLEKERWVEGLSAFFANGAPGNTNLLLLPNYEQKNDGYLLSAVSSFYLASKGKGSAEKPNITRGVC